MILSIRQNLKLAGAITLGIALSGCASPIVQDTSRDVAKGVVNDVVQTRFPGVNAAPYTDCIIDNATGEEVFSLAQNALTQNTNAAASTVLEISGRPDTSNCLATNALASLLG